jgi:CO/xanthine dehydrogenase Mo-binding subunit
MVRVAFLAAVGARPGLRAADLSVRDDEVVDSSGAFRMPVMQAAQGLSFDETFEHHHRATEPLDENGQGNCHVAFAFVAHRAVVDVDLDLGLVKVVQVATAQDVGKALNPLSVTGQIEGGIAQGLGLAVMEEIVVTEGRVRNPSFTDYLLPTILDSPVVDMRLVEVPEPLSPLGAKGVGEPPCISVTPAIANAIRAATGRAIDRVPVRPQDICL